MVEHGIQMGKIEDLLKTYQGDNNKRGSTKKSSPNELWVWSIHCNTTSLFRLQSNQQLWHLKHHIPLPPQVLWENLTIALKVGFVSLEILDLYQSL